MQNLASLILLLSNASYHVTFPEPSPYFGLITSEMDWCHLLIKLVKALSCMWEDGAWDGYRVGMRRVQMEITSAYKTLEFI